MELDQIVLLDMLHDVIENLEWSVQEIEQLRQSVYSGPELQRHHLADSARIHGTSELSSCATSKSGQPNSGSPAQK